jgi:hypothetical protein
VPWPAFLRSACEVEFRDYVSDTPAANPLLGLLGDPVEQSALDTLQDATMRQHLAEALAEAEAVKVNNVDELLDQHKPRLLGFFKGGRREFEQYVQGALGKLLKKNDSEEEQPWKVA